jgi:hypothetical protein
MGRRLTGYLAASLTMSRKSGPAATAGIEERVIGPQTWHRSVAMVRRYKDTGGPYVFAVVKCRAIEEVPGTNLVTYRDVVDKRVG